MTQNPIAIERRAAGLTQRQLAAKVGVSKGAVSQWEMADGTSVEPSNALKLVKVLPNLTLDKIYGHKPRARAA